MTAETQLGLELKSYLEHAKAAIRAYTGLITKQNLTRDVIADCNEVQSWLERHDAIDGAKANCCAAIRVEVRIANVEARCNELVKVTATRDAEQISRHRTMALEAIDTFQTQAFTWGRANGKAEALGYLQKGRSI